MKPSWRLRKPDPAGEPVPSGLFPCSPLVIRLLQARGLTTNAEIESYLASRLSDLNSPFLLQGIIPAIDRIKQAITVGERIGIFSDSDLDGMTSLAVLIELFRRFKIKPFYRFLKNDETYGLTDDIIDEFREAGVRLLITVDSGIRDVAQIARARELNIDCIVTDHHEQDVVLPDAIIVNPRLNSCEYPFKHLAGVGVAFKLSHAVLLSYLPAYGLSYGIITRINDRYAMALLKNGTVSSITEVGSIEDALRNTEGMVVLLKGIREAVSPDRRIYDFDEFIAGVLARTGRTTESLTASFGVYRRLNQPHIQYLVKLFLEVSMVGSEKILDFLRAVIGFVAIGTIADVMPLLNENRILVRWGLEELRKTGHEGLSLLIGNGPVDAKRIGWEIAPLLNTPGRLGRTELTADFFLERDGVRVREVIGEIKTLNEGRKQQINEFFNGIVSDIDAGNAIINDRIVFIKSNAIPDGYAGLVASRVSERIEKPVIIAVHTGKDGIYKGSGRLKGRGNFFSWVEPFSANFIRIGGHAQAFGFTITGDCIDEIMKKINDAIDPQLVERDVVLVDIELEPADIQLSFVDELTALEPFGNANEEPLFLSRGVRPLECQRFGNGHAKYKLAENGGLEIVGWNRADEMESLFEKGALLDICFRLDRSTFRGITMPRMIVVDIDPV